MRRAQAAFLICCLLCLRIVGASPQAIADGLPAPFVEVDTIIPGIVVDLRYFSDNNFMGRRVAGYDAPKCILTRPAAEALRGVQQELNKFGMGLKIFDAYRPQRAVNDFVQWAKDLSDTKMQGAFYPNVHKSGLFRDGYIAERSGHSRGSTVDLTIVSLDKQTLGRELDMGTQFDFFGPESAPDSTLVSPAQRVHRMLLQVLMRKHGFQPYAKEWWHFTLTEEPFPDTYFDFPVR